MNVLAIITARGGSKRIPRKNIKPFFGKPMLAYAVDAARTSGVFSEIMVSTDDDEIATVARSAGASVPFMRSARTADDHATTYDVIAEVLDSYKSLGRTFDAICCIYPCVPFLTAQTLVSAFGALGPDVNGVIPVCRYPVPIEWAMRISQGLLVPADPAAQLIRSQDIEPKYYDAGMFYYERVSALLEHRTLVPPGTAAWVIDDSECQDIDTPEDWEMAEMKYQLLHGGGLRDSDGIRREESGRVQG